MKLNKYIALLGCFNLFTLPITEIMLVGNFEYDVYSFNMLSVMGIIITILNAIFLYLGYKYKFRMIVLITILLATLYGVFLSFSIYAIMYRWLMVINGAVLLSLSNRYN